MINWDGDVIFLSCRPYGENGVIASVFSKDFGRYKGWVFGGNSLKRKSCLQQGNYLSAQWKARIPEQMGTIKLELIKSISIEVIEKPIKLGILNSVCAITDLILPEREPNHKIFENTKKLLGLIGEETISDLKCLKNYIHWELNLLSDLGFGLELSKCIVTGSDKELSFVSPKSGKAVCNKVGMPYKNKLLILPRFLGGIIQNGCEDEKNDILNGFNLSGYFLKSCFAEYHSKNTPRPRQWLLQLVSNIDL